MTSADCWNTIGIGGDRSCPELARLAHCQNCPVYAEAAQSLLDREPPVGYKAAATAHFAEPRVATQRATESVVVFSLGSEWMALPTAVVAEIARMRQIHSLPQRRGAIEGVANVHGELVVCISLDRLLGLAASAGAGHQVQETAASRILVIQREDVRAVCRVDEVHGIHRFHHQEVQDVPETVARSASTFTRKVFTWRERSIGLLNEHLLLIALKRSFA
jgi:chemotaxis-related protein WspD